MLLTMYNISRSSSGIIILCAENGVIHFSISLLVLRQQEKYFQFRKWKFPSADASIYD